MGLAERIFCCDGCGLALDRDRNAAMNLAAWAEHFHAPVPDRQAGGRVINALERKALAITLAMVKPVPMKGEPRPMPSWRELGHPRRVLPDHLMTRSSGGLQLRPSRRMAKITRRISTVAQNRPK